MPTPKIPKIPKSVRESILQGNRGLNETIDIWWMDDFKPEMPEVYGQVALMQRIYRRITCPKGLFPWWPNDGIDIRSYILSKVPLWLIKSDIVAQVLRDEQVDDVIVIPEFKEGGKVLNCWFDVISEVGNFNFTMTADEAAAKLLSLQASGV